MILSILPMSAVETLRGSLASIDALRRYTSAGPDLTEFKPLNSAIDLTEPPVLDCSGGTKEERAATDLENAIRVHGWLGPLEETVASDLRLWVTLTHREFFPYTKWRWPLVLAETPTDEQVEVARRHVVAHWFFKGAGLSAMRRNSVARLWWAAHLTHAPWDRDPDLEPLRKDDPYFFTRVLLKNQDIYQGLIEREFAVNRRILATMLELIGRDLQTRGTSEFVTKLLVQVNLMARFRELTLVPPQALVAEFEKQLAAGS